MYAWNNDIVMQISFNGFSSLHDNLNLFEDLLG